VHAFETGVCIHVCNNAKICRLHVLSVFAAKCYLYMAKLLCRHAWWEPSALSLGMRHM
jgi:hypothetical protein